MYKVKFQMTPMCVFLFFLKKFLLYLNIFKTKIKSNQILTIGNKQNHQLVMTMEIERERERKRERKREGRDRERGTKPSYYILILIP